MAKKLKHEDGRIFVLCSDGEMQEGSSWEGIQFAVANELSNLIVIIDHNGIQGIDTTENVLGPNISLSRKLNAFGADAIQIGLDSFMEYDRIMMRDKKVGVMIVDTVKGKGVSFMENKMEWHYKPMSTSEYEQALAENPDA